MVAYARRRQCARIITLAALAALVCGCKTIEGGPERLYPIADEVARARGLLDGVGDWRGLEAQYYAVTPATSAAPDEERKYLRNEIIARRMYLIDVEYSEYETALTTERQKFGFLTTTAATGLGIASTLTTPLRSAQLLSGIGAGVLGARGAYDSEVVLAKTIQIVQGHMRAERANVATTQILPRRTESTITYPLSAALRDLEDYYLAGTFTSGLIPALRESGNAAEVAADAKARVVRGVWGPDNSTVALEQFLRPNGILNRPRLACVNSCLNKFPMLRRPGSPRININARMNDAESATIRVHALQCVQSAECSVLP
jgi:hypothetical protein